MSYLTTVKQVYRKAATEPDKTLCCVPQAPVYLPGLVIPPAMAEMNYGCGSTVHLADMRAGQRILYVGVGGGLEALKLAYFAQRPGGVIAVDPVPEMRTAARKNLQEAARLNDWFDPSFVDIRAGDALKLPLDDESVDLAAQNCLFNIFMATAPGKSGDGAIQASDLDRALQEMHRVLADGGRLSMSDPITPRPMPGHLKDDEILRAKCISGCVTLDHYLQTIVSAGFGTVEVRTRKPYRMLQRTRYGLDEDLLLESIEVCAVKVPVPDDGPCIFTGRTAIYSGPDETFDDGRGHILVRDLPASVCDKTAAALADLGRPDLTVTGPTWHYSGGGCC
ncbi:MAG: arsenosugar biosynthesis arsenite methyltransferase ArsM [Planctomycetes bacterium]|nr:arsenosugar biosynthesis arsenite methyltransferase ArsM [Planctomycetota bacterium]